MVQIKKRKHPKFNIPNFGTKKRKRVKARWRKQRGIDNKKRVKKNFMGAEPTIGWGNKKEIKGLRINNKKPVLIKNINEFKHKLKEFENEKQNYLFILSHDLGMKKRLELINLAKQNNIKVSNKNINEDLLNKIKNKQLNNNKKEPDKKPNTEALK
ncbi:MAG: hypothetical protein M1168_00545 [Candidatus Marsarchaeota archaeon]|nr:hypothetical protein [Candidatus Marsarchaeota archaeon]MCL5094459.1 hypothetical protein [Candidatus Marsarchaeota archaeon]